MTLRQRQSRFALMVASLIQQAYAMGYEVTLAEAWRPPAQAELMASQGKGIKDSLHINRLAIDLNLFKDGVYLSSTEAHRPLGEWWEKQHEDCRWGGRFKDGNHYSMTYQGRA
jgi:hypothetical protein